MLGDPVVSSGERNFKINRAQFQDALFSLVAGFNLTQIQQIQNIRFFSDWLLCSPFLFFDWLISGTSRQHSRGFGETCLIPQWWGQCGQVMFARCSTLNSLEFFFSVRNTMCGGSAWTKDRNEWLSRSMRDTWEPWNQHQNHVCWPSTFSYTRNFFWV